jgi:hypothetical protein
LVSATIVTHNLSVEQYVTLWSKHERCLGVNSSMEARYHIWYTQYKHKFRLEYTETADGFYGLATITGRDKDVNWFLLQL